MGNVMRWSEERLDEYQAARARKYAKQDFVDIGIGTMRAEHVDTEKGRGATADARTGLPRVLGESVAAVAPQMTMLPLRRMSFELPLPPSVNDLYGIGKGGQKFLVVPQREFRTQVIAIVRSKTRTLEGRIPPLDGRICLRAAFYQDNNIRQDISNRIKALEDALKHAGAYRDDSQIDKLIVERRYSSRAACVVELEEIA